MMMKVSQDRYTGVGTATIEDEAGGSAIYRLRRFLPPGAEIESRRMLEATQMVERLDLIAALTLGDAFAFWRICDANDAMNPFDVVAECEGQVRIPSELVS
jgi:hypothetical protein